MLDLTLKSPIHAKWLLEDCYRLFTPPLELGQYVTAQEGSELVGFATYGKLSDEATYAFTHGTRKLQPEDWCSGSTIWLIDCIAPFGHATVVTRLLREHLRAQGHIGEGILYRRKYSDGRVRISRSQI